MARTIDKSIRAPLDLSGERWAKKPNRYDFPGIDDPKSAQKHAEMQRYIEVKIKGYIRKHKTAVKADWDKMNAKQRKEFIADLEKSMKPLSVKGSANLTKKELDYIAAAGAIL